MPHKPGVLRPFSRLLQQIEDSILISLLLIMITMAVLQIFLRNFFDSGIVWGDSLVRVLVLWIGLVGAMVASRTDNHISIDILSRYLPPAVKPFTTLATHVFTAVVTALMAWFSLDFVQMEMQDQMIAFANVPAWVCESIIPIAFLVISIRYTLFSINLFVQLVAKKTMIYLFVGSLILMAFLGAPLFTVITAGAMAGFYMAQIDLSVMAIELYRIADTPILLALPLFTFAGYLLGESNTSQRLVRLTQAFLGWMPGGLAIVAFVVCALFTAFTGASGVTIVAMGALLYPALKQAGYQDNFSLGLVTTSGSLGLLLPPSLPLILYGIIAQQMGGGVEISIEDLFIAGIFPAILMIFMLSLWSIWVNKKNPIPLIPFSWTNAFTAIREAAWEIPLPIFVFTGIYSGYFAVSEAAAVTAMYVLVVEVFVYREIKLSQLAAIIRESMVMVGGILLILGVSLALTNFLIDAEVPMKLFAMCQTFVNSKLVFLILLNIFLLILGAMLDIFSAIIIMVPLMLPVALEYGVHPVHLGIIFLANMQIGYFTPPVGMNLFIASYRFNKPIVDIYRATIPFMLVLLLSVLIITYWPALSLFLIS